MSRQRSFTTPVIAPWSPPPNVQKALARTRPLDARETASPTGKETRLRSQSTIEGSDRNTLGLPQARAIRLSSIRELDIWGIEEQPTVEEEDQGWQERKKKIIRRILDEFSVEKTIEKYQDKHQPIEYKVDPKNFSVQCAAESEVIRKRMLYLMGTDTCHINDRKFIERLQVRVQDEYEKEQENKEKQLAEKERQRQRRLLSDGVLTSEQLREQDSYKRQKYRRMRTPPPGEENDRKLVQEKARPITYNEKKDKDKKKEERRNSKDEQEQQENKEDEEQEKRDEEKEEGEQGEEGQKPESERGEEEQVQDGEQHEWQDDEGWHCDSDRPNYKARNDDPLIQKLRHQETTDGIYHLADEVLRGQQCGNDCSY